MDGSASSCDMNNRTANNQNQLSFPKQLMNALSDPTISDLVTWLPSGKGWKIINKDRFQTEVLPRYFGQKASKWTSFTRRLRRWNFTRVNRGPQTGAYYHPLFQREMPHLCDQMNCIGDSGSHSLEPLSEEALSLATPNMLQRGLTAQVGAPRNDDASLLESSKPRPTSSFQVPYEALDPTPLSSTQNTDVSPYQVNLESRISTSTASIRGAEVLRRSDQPSAFLRLQQQRDTFINNKLTGAAGANLQNKATSLVPPAGLRQHSHQEAARSLQSGTSTALVLQNHYAELVGAARQGNNDRRFALAHPQAAGGDSILLASSEDERAVSPSIFDTDTSEKNSPNEKQQPARRNEHKEEAALDILETNFVAAVRRAEKQMGPSEQDEK